MISSKQLAQALYRLSKEVDDHKKITSAFNHYLEKYNLQPLLRGTLRHLTEIQSKQRKHHSLEITSGLPIDEDITREIKELLDVKSDAKVEKHTDKTLIGGFVATYKGLVYDASLKKQLHLLRNNLIKN